MTCLVRLMKGHTQEQKWKFVLLYVALRSLKVSSKVDFFFFFFIMGCSYMPILHSDRVYWSFSSTFMFFSYLCSKMFLMIKLKFCKKKSACVFSSGARQTYIDRCCHFPYIIDSTGKTIEEDNSCLWRRAQCMCLTLYCTDHGEPASTHKATML